MALVVLSGLPSSGKTRICESIKLVLGKACADSDLAVKVVDEGLLAMSRDSCYQNTVSEKNTRGRLKAAVERSLTKNSIVIFDSLNNIKGYRYEVWCVARACGCRYCLVHVDVPAATAKTWNTSRTGDQYSAEVFEDLAGRYEIPDSKNRWEAPLFRIDPTSQDLNDAIEQIVTLACSSSAQSQQQQQILQQQRALKPTVATTTQRLSSTNLLHDFDKASQEVITSIMQSQSGAPGRPSDLDLSLDRPVSMPELRRLKRDFMKLLTQLPTDRLQDVSTARRMFLEYLQTHVH